MKKYLISAGLILTFLIFTPGFTEEKGNSGKTEPQIEKPLPPMMRHPRMGARMRLRRVLEIRRKMRKIEKETIKEDEELQQIFQEIRTLQQELRSKLDEKLADNQEYQELKKQLEEIKAEWKKKHPKFEEWKKKGKGYGREKGK